MLVLNYEERQGCTIDLSRLLGLVEILKIEQHPEAARLAEEFLQQFELQIRVVNNKRAGRKTEIGIEADKKFKVSRDRLKEPVAA